MENETFSLEKLNIKDEWLSIEKPNMENEVLSIENFNMENEVLSIENFNMENEVLSIENFNMENEVLSIENFNMENEVLSIENFNMENEVLSIENFNMENEVLSIENLNTESEALYTIRTQYAEDIEELVQCPVCFERPSGLVPTCVQGHHVCVQCQQKMILCPICNCRFKGSGNYLAENLRVQFDDIVDSLLDPSRILKKKLIDDKKSIGTQTDLQEDLQKDLQKDLQEDLKKDLQEDKSASSAEDEKIMCRIGLCQLRLSSNYLYFHCRDYHNVRLIEATSLHDGYIKYWKFNFELDKLYDYGINIKDMGFFFFNIYIDEDGIVFANVQIVHSCYDEMKFHHTLILTNHDSDESLGYNGSVQPFKAQRPFSFACSFSRDLFESYFEDNMTNLKNQPRPFTCRLILTRLITNPEEFVQKLNSTMEI